MDTYQQTVDWMFKQLPMFQQVGVSAFEKDLTNTLKLASYLNHPEKQFKSIHIAGTNGKGSTSSLIASVLQEAGYKVGLYTSPHLVDFRERIRINGTEISKDFVVDFIDKHRSFFEANHLSFFEMTVGMAFDYFAKQQVDVAVIEVGLGGRLDATNIINPLISVITNIGWDHMNILGNSIEEIAFEKAGIIKQNTPVVIGEYTSETQKVFDKIANHYKAPIHYASLNNEIPDLPSDLIGLYQLHNKKTAYQALQLAKVHFTILQQHIEKGFLNVGNNTGLKGRWSILGNNPLIVADTAHNVNGLKMVMTQIHQHNFNRLYIVLGMANDKDINTIINVLPKNATYFIAKPNVPRGLDANILLEKLRYHSLNATAFESITSALAAAKKYATKDDMIYIGGSTFVVAEVV